MTPGRPCRGRRKEGEEEEEGEEREDGNEGAEEEEERQGEEAVVDGEEEEGEEREEREEEKEGVEEEEKDDDEEGGTMAYPTCTSLPVNTILPYYANNDTSLSTCTLPSLPLPPHLSALRALILSCSMVRVLLSSWCSRST